MKKNKYLLEGILPRSFCEKVFPRKVFNYFFREHVGVSSSDYYSRYVEECKNVTERQKSEFEQILDTLKNNNIPLLGKTVLDISGGPGYVGKRLNDLGASCVVTEFSEASTKAMAEVLKIKSIKFDYNNDQLQNIFSTKFDIVMLRSSIIFCSNLDEFIASIKTILKPDGYILLETIVPTLGEVLWWQWMEYKFPLIYSQETIEKLFWKHGFSWVYGQRDYGSYFNYYKQLRDSFISRLFMYFIEYPLVLFYYFLAKKSSISIDTNLKHKVLTHIWQYKDVSSKLNDQKIEYRDYYIGRENHSAHFGLVYNNYLKNK